MVCPFAHDFVFSTEADACIPYLYVSNHFHLYDVYYIAELHPYTKVCRILCRYEMDVDRGLGIHISTYILPQINIHARYVVLLV